MALPVKRIRPIVFVAAAILIASLLLIWIFSFPHNRSYRLPDGTVLRFEGITYGTNTLQRGGLSVQRSLWMITPKWMRRHVAGNRLWRQPLTLPPNRLYGQGQNVVLFWFSDSSRNSTFDEDAMENCVLVNDSVKIEIVDSEGRSLTPQGTGRAGTTWDSYSCINFRTPLNLKQSFTIRIAGKSDTGNSQPFLTFPVQESLERK